jgi:hypothetical protein
LVVSVVGIDGAEYVTPTLSEALVHLRSSSGWRIQLTEDVSTFVRREESQEGHLGGGRRTTRLTIDRTADGFEVVEIDAAQRQEIDSGLFFDYTRDPPVELTGRMRVQVVDVDIDRPQPWPAPDLPSA